MDGQTLAAALALMKAMPDNAASSAASAAASAEAAQEVLESIPQDYTTLSNDVTNLKNAINDILFTNITVSWNSTNGYIKIADGGVSTSQYWKRADFIPVPEDAKGLYYTCPKSDDTLQIELVSSVAFYTSNDISTYINDGSAGLKSGETKGLEYTYLSIPATAKYMRFSVLADFASSYIMKYAKKL